MAQYDIVTAARTPAQTSAPTLAELGPLYGTFSIVEELDGPGSGDFNIDITTLTSDIKDRLRDLLTYPTEIWVYRDGVMIYAGPIIGGQINDTVITLGTRGLQFYLQYMYVTTNKTWTAIDQFTIAKEVVDDWQALDYGNFGIVTTGIGTSGQTRTIFIPGALEPIAVGTFLRDLGAADNGFDSLVVPDTRELVLSYPRKGTDLSSSVFLERGIQSPDIRFSVAPGVVCSDVFLTATGEGSDPLTSTAFAAGIRSTFGRAGFATSADNVIDQTMSDDLAQGVLDARSTALFQPGARLLPVAGAQYDDFSVGDTVTYSFDAGLGLQSGSYRVTKRSISVGTDGNEIMAVEFE